MIEVLMPHIIYGAIYGALFGAVFGYFLESRYGYFTEQVYSASGHVDWVNELSNEGSPIVPASEQTIGDLVREADQLFRQSKTEQANQIFH